MALTRRHLLTMAASAAVTPTLPSLACAQIEPKPPSIAAPLPFERATMEALARSFMSTYAVPALSFAVGYAGTIVHQNAFGLADRESKEAVTPERLFRIASISKPITSVSIFRLIEQKRVRLTDKVFGRGAILGTDYGPPESPGVDQITLEHLLTHTAGGWSNEGRDPMFALPQMSQAELIARTIANEPLDHPPGETYAYSNFGYCVLGRVIEKLTGRPYADHVRAEVLSRCGITDMTIAGNTLDERQPREVRYFGQNDNPYGMNVRRMDSHGGWLARPADLVRFFMHVDGYAKPANILQPQTISVMTTASTANSGYAKGWNVNRSDNWWHNGSLPGTSTIAVRTHGGFCWAAFTNSRRRNSRLDADLDRLNWNMVRAVESWRVS
jgi:CubicO group peptidase (beta-lactamase class C family)